jgi:glycosyltransferase involved in cell wall biosynthesis
VVTDVGDSARIVDQTGVVVPPRDAEALYLGWKKLVQLGEGGRRALGERARARVLERYELGNIVRQFETFYRRALRNANCRRVSS